MRRGQGTTRVPWQGTARCHSGWGAAVPACGATVPSQSDIPRGIVSSWHGSGRRSPLADIAEPQRMQSLESRRGESQRSGRCCRALWRTKYGGVTRVSPRECVGGGAGVAGRANVRSNAAESALGTCLRVPSVSIASPLLDIDGLFVPCTSEALVRTARRAVLQQQAIVGPRFSVQRCRTWAC